MKIDRDIKPGVGVYTGRPGPTDLCNYRTVDGTGRPVQIQHGSSWTVQFCSEGGFPISSILHGSTRPGRPVARVRRPGGLGSSSSSSSNVNIMYMYIIYIPANDRVYE